MTLLRKAALATAVAALSIAAAPKAADWTRTVSVTADGAHLIGNPQAPVKLVEFVSYTCSHCAHYAEESDVPLRTRYVAPGKLSVEVRHFVRDPVDLTVAMLTNCGPVAKFQLNHAAFMRSQSTWMAPISSMTAAQRERWNTGEATARRRAIAADLKFYQIMQTRGYDRASVDRCLANEGMARRLADMTQDGAARGVSGTPSFQVNGVLLAGTHSWPVLDMQLGLRM